MRLKCHSSVFQITMSAKLRSTHPLYFMILADITERKVQECLKLGITADFGTTSFSDGKAHANRNGCENVTTKNQGLLFLFHHIKVLSKPFCIKSVFKG